MVNSFLVQTCPEWKIYIIHDGPMPKEVKKIIEQFKNDKRISFMETAKRTGYWGHKNRNMILQILPDNTNDFVLITNDDNYYVPVFVEEITKVIRPDTGMIHWDMIHSNYEFFPTRVGMGTIDMGSFIVRLPLAKKVGFIHTGIEADCQYAMECLEECKKENLSELHVPKILFVHN
jgi:hypothetical protein